MLPAELVRARRRANQLKLTHLRGPERQEAIALAEQLLELTKASLGISAEELTEVLMSVDRAAKHEKLFAGLKKLVLDACQFSSPLALDAVMLRKKVFEHASAVRSQASVELPFQRQAVLEQLARELGVSAADIEQGLFGDLKGAQLFVNAPVLSPQELVERYFGAIPAGPPVPPVEAQPVALAEDIHQVLTASEVPSVSLPRSTSILAPKR